MAVAKHFVLPKESNNQTENTVLDPLQKASLSGDLSAENEEQDQQAMFDLLIGNIDPKLRERIEECQRLKSTLPLTKEIVKYKILERRAKQGLAEIEITFNEKKAFPLTEEEKERRQRRREQNKKAAARCRNRRKLRDRFLTQEFSIQLEKNVVLREVLKKLKAERDGLIKQLVEHEKNCPMLAQTRQMAPTHNHISESNQNNNDNYNNNNDDDICSTFLTAKTIPASGNLSLDFLPVAKTENSEANTLCPFSTDKLCTNTQSAYNLPFTKADGHAHVSSNTLFPAGTSNEEDGSLEIFSFPFPSPSSSPTFRLESPLTPIFSLPSSFPPLSTSPLCSATNLTSSVPPRPVPLSSAPFSSPSTETSLLSPHSIPFPSPTTFTSNFPVHLSSIPPEACSFSSSSHFSPPSPFSF